MPFLAPAVAAITAFASTAIGSFLIRLAISFVIGRIQQNRMKKKMEAMQQANRPSVMVNTASNNEAIPVAYGHTRMGGNRVYTQSTNGAGDTNGTSHLVMIFSLSEGPVGGLSKLWFDDKVVWDITDGGSIDGAGKLSGFISEFTPSLDESGTHIVYHNGEENQVADGILKTAIGADWTDDHRLRGTAYVAVVLKANAEVYKGGLPLITAQVYGKTIQNISSLPTVDLYSSADMDPVDVLYDYMTNARYGKGLSPSTIDLSSFQSARTQHAGYFKVNGVMDTGLTLYDNIGELLETMNGVLTFQNGVYSLRLKRANETSVKTFTHDEILSPVSIQMPAKEAKFNSMLADYRNRAAGTDYNDDIVIVKNATYLTEDNDVELEGRIRLDFVDDETLVNSIATYQMAESRYQMTVSFNAAHTALKVECGEIISLQLPEFGWDTPKQFRVATMGINADNTIEFTAQEYVSEIQLI